MKQIKNPLKVKEALKSFPLSDIFSKDYSSEFLLFEYEKDEFLIREGELNNYLLFTHNGTVKCFSYSSNGKTQFITYIKASEAIGLIGTIWGQTAVSNIQAIHKCQCLALPMLRCRDELLNDNKFLRYLCHQLGETIFTSNRHLQVIQCSSIESKIAAIILGNVENGICHLNLSSTAEVVGTTYRHVLRILNKFCNNQVLEKSGRDYIVKDEDYLSLCSEDAYDYIVNEHFNVN